MKNYKILSELRKKQGLTAKKVAKILNIDPSTISYYERGLTEPSIDVLAKLADIYRVSLDYLILGENNGITITNEEYEILMNCRKVLNDLQIRHETIIKNSNNTIIANNSNINFESNNNPK